MPVANADVLLAAQDDVSADYMQHAQALSVDSRIERFRDRMQKRDVQPGAEPAPVAPAPAPQAPGERAPTQITVFPKRPGQDRTVLEYVGAVAKDVGGGFVESPSAVVAGVNDAVRNTAGALDEFINWADAGVLSDQVPDDVLRMWLPERPPDQNTTTGKVIRSGAEFLTGFIPAMRALRGLSAVPKVAKIVGAGGISDFFTRDPTEEGLSNLVQQVPAIANPVNEFLATDPNDNDAVNRLRHSLEGAGFGLLTEGMVRGLRAVAQGKKAKSEMQVQVERYGRAQESMNFLGDPAAPHVVSGKAGTEKLTRALKETETGVPDQVAARGVAAGADDAAAGRALQAVEPADDLFVNFARVDSPDDVQTVIRDMANAMKPQIDEARRGVQTHDQTAKLADDLGMSVEDLLARRKGQPLSAEESLAARRLWATSAQKLLDASRRAADANAGPVDLYNFRRMMAVHHAIQSEVVAARTETARALSAWRIPAGGNMEAARNIEMLLEASGGNAVSAELARRIATLGAQGVPPAALAETVRRGWAATTMDAVKEAYVLGLLWSPTTHLVNAGSNMIVGFQQIYERAVANKIGDFLGSAIDERVVDGEALAMTYGLVTSLKDALRLGARALRTGETGAGLGKIDLPREKAISTEAISRELGHGVAEAAQFAESPMGRFVDFTGTVTRVPGNVLAAEDEFFKTIAYRAEVHAQALRQASQEGLSGPDLFKRMAEIANSPPEHIRMAAADAALYATFQNRPGEWAQALMRLRNSGSFNPMFLVLPFVRTPANILRYTFERTPLAPLVKQWRDDIAAGGARRDIALARMASGSAILAVGMDLASSGLITGPGPSDPGKREALQRQGWQPNSIVVDGKYYSFNRADPLGMIFGFAGAVAEKMKESDNAPEDFDDWEEIMAGGIAAISASVVDKTYFTGIAETLSMIQGSEKGEGGVARFIDRQTGSMLPMTTAFGAVKRFVDPVSRDVNSPWDAIHARIAGLSDNLPPARNLWGEERAPQEVYGRVFDALSPVYVRQRQESPIDAEIERQDISIRRIPKKTVFQGVNVNFREFPEVYDEYVRLSGNDLKHPAWGKGAKDMLDQVVSGKHPLSGVYQIYSDGPEGTKADFIRNTVSEYRKLAQQAIMDKAEREYPDFYEYVTGDRVRQDELKMPRVPGAAPPRAGDGPRLPQ